MSNGAAGVSMPEQHLQLIAGLLKVQVRGIVIGFKFSQLQVNAIEVGGAYIARVEANFAQLYRLAVALHVVFGHFQPGLGGQHLGKGLFHGKDRLPLGIAVLALRNVGCGVGQIETPPPLLPSFKEARDDSPNSSRDCQGYWPAASHPRH